MPNIASAKKNMRKSRAAQVRNRAQRSALRTALKKAASSEVAADVIVSATTLLDRSARKGLIHKNSSARLKRPAWQERQIRPRRSILRLERRQFPAAPLTIPLCSIVK